MKWLAAVAALFFSVNLAAAENLADVTLQNLQGESVQLSQYKGKPLYIKMWASWCPICLAGLAEIEALSAAPNEKFNIITVASPTQKNEKSTADFVKWYKGLDYPHIQVLLDENGELIKRLNVQGYPFNVFLDKDLDVLKAQPGHLNGKQIEGGF